MIGVETDRSDLNINIMLIKCVINLFSYFHIKILLLTILEYDIISFSVHTKSVRKMTT